MNIAAILLKLKAVHLSPDNFFTWTSGLKSPIYCDNRKIISHIDYREFIVDSFVDQLKLQDIDVIAGTATAGISWAAWIAQKMQKPMIYIRSGAKGHGLKNAIEGELTAKSKVAVIEDLISTGKSSIAAAKEVINSDAQVVEVKSIFEYGFAGTKESFNQNKISYSSLCTLEELLQYAKDNDLLSKEQIEIIVQWKENIKMP